MNLKGEMFMAAGWDALRKQGQEYMKKVESLYASQIMTEEEKAISDLIYNQSREILKIRKELQLNPDYFDYEAQCNFCLTEESIIAFQKEEAARKGEFYMRISYDELAKCEENIYRSEGKFYINLEHPVIAEKLQDYMFFHNITAPLTTLQRLEFEHKCNLEFTRLQVNNKEFFDRQFKKSYGRIERD